MSTITIEMTPQEFQRIIAATVENVIDRKFDEWLDGLEDDGELRPEIGEQLLRLRRERQEGICAADWSSAGNISLTLSFLL